jgi:type II secretory pathway component PulF
MQNKITAFVVSGFLSTLIILFLIFISLFLSNNVVSNCNCLLLFNIIIGGIVMAKKREFRAVGLGILIGGGLPILFILDAII